MNQREKELDRKIRAYASGQKVEISQELNDRFLAAIEEGKQLAAIQNPAEDKKVNAGKKKIWIMNWNTSRRIAAACAGVLVLTVAGVGVHATVDYGRQRAELLTESEQQEYVDINNVANMEAYSFSRDMTEEEQQRMQELKDKYQFEGVFPTGAIQIVKEDQPFAEDVVAYNIHTGEIFLPERELTDEDLLELIDFYQLTDYSYIERTKASQETEDQTIDEISFERPSGYHSMQDIYVDGLTVDEESYIAEYDNANALAMDFLQTDGDWKKAEIVYRVLEDGTLRKGVLNYYFITDTGDGCMVNYSANLRDFYVMEEMDEDAIAAKKMADEWESARTDGEHLTYTIVTVDMK